MPLPKSVAAAFDPTPAAAARNADEPLWQLPLEQRYRKQLDSPIADMKNIAGTMCADAADSWRTKGATGFGTRLLIEGVPSPSGEGEGRVRVGAAVASNLGQRT